MGNDEGKLPAHLRRKLAAMLCAFRGTSGRSAAEVAAGLLAYKTALEPFDDAIAEDALTSLTLANPRNPFTPTPQDLFERAELISAYWRRFILAWALGVPTSPTGDREELPGPRIEFEGLPFSESCRLRPMACCDVIQDYAMGNVGQAGGTVANLSLTPRHPGERVPVWAFSEQEWAEINTVRREQKGIREKCLLKQWQLAERWLENNVNARLIPPKTDAGPSGD